MKSSQFKRIILDHISNALKPEGFRKSREIFSCDQGDSIIFVQLQSSAKESRHDLLVCTINLGIFSRTVAQSVRNTHKPNILEAHWRKRIGRFMANPNDKWWEISNDEQARAAGQEIVDVLCNITLTEMRSLASADNLKSLWNAGSSPGLTDYERRQYLQALDMTPRAT